MDKKLALPITIVVIAFALIILFLAASNLAGKPTTEQLVIANFAFTEIETGPADFTAAINGDKVSFEGPISKPTPCHSLSASYKTGNEKVTVEIKADAGEGFCIQVIKDSFYKGSFDLKSGTLKQIDVVFAGQTIGTKTF